MADVTVDQATASPVTSPTPKKAAGKKPAAGKARVKPSHPPTSEMVNSAIKSLKERGGSSLQAIKKYIAANYKVDGDKMSPFIRRYLKVAVASGTLVQTKGKGASGSFKLSAPNTKSGNEKSVVAAKAADTAPKISKTSSRARAASNSAKVSTAKQQVKKPVKMERSKSVAKKATPKKVPAPARNPPKMRKASKGPAKKVKAPKPKTAKKAPASSPRKGTASRRR